MDDIDIVEQLRSDEHRRLHDFEKVTLNPSGDMRLVAGDHVGGWSVSRHSFEGENVRYTLFYSGSPPTPPVNPPT